MNIVAFAYSGFGHAGLEALLRSRAQVRLVVSHSDQPGENIWWPSVSALCAERGIPVVLDPDFKDPAFAQRLRECAPELMFSFYFRRMIPMRLLDLARGGGYNLHGSLLPRYRGRSPINWQLVMGERMGGLTLHRMVRQADAGDVVAQLGLEIGPDETAAGLVRRLLEAAPALLDRAIAELLEGRAVHRPQDHRLATVFPGRKPADGEIDWSGSARAVHNLVRAVSRPFPGAFAWRMASGELQRLMVWSARVAADHGAGAIPGEVRPDGLVTCGEGLIDIREASDEAGNPIRLQSGELLHGAPKPSLEIS